MIEMIQKIVQSGAGFVAHEPIEAGQPYHATLVSQGFDLVVSLIPGMITQCFTVSMGIDNRFFGYLNRIECALISGVSYIDDHAQFVHAPDHVDTEITQASLCSFGAPVSHPISPIERQLDLA